MSLPEECRHAGCTRQRGRLSVFCDEHHQEQLVRFGMIPEHPDPCGVILKRCQGSVRAHEMGAITADELQDALFDQLVHAGTQGLTPCFETVFNSLPTDVLSHLLAVVKRHTGPRLFHPLPTLETERRAKEKSALAAQAALVEALEYRLSQHNQFERKRR